MIILLLFVCYLCEHLLCARAHTNGARRHQSTWSSSSQPVSLDPLRGGGWGVGLNNAFYKVCLRPWKTLVYNSS